MARLQNPFNANQVDPTQGGHSQLPPGKHPVRIVASEIKAAANNNNNGLVLFELECTAGPAAGVKMQWRLNLYHSSQQTREIAEKQLSALCHATGVFIVEETQALHGKDFGVLVTEQALTAEQQEKKNRGESVTPFTQVSKILNTAGEEPKANAQQGQGGNFANNQTQNGNGGGNGSWGGNQGTQQSNQQPNQQPNQNGNQGGGSWGGQQSNQNQNPNQAGGNGGGGSWGQQGQQPQPSQQGQGGNGGGNGGWSQNANGGGQQNNWGR